jgi:hypothetical protein
LIKTVQACLNFISINKKIPYSCGLGPLLFPPGWPTCPRFSPLPLPPTASWGPCARGRCQSGRHSMVGTRPSLPHLMPPRGAPCQQGPGPISIPHDCTTVAYKKGRAPLAPLFPASVLSHSCLSTPPSLLRRRCPPPPSGTGATLSSTKSCWSAAVLPFPMSTSLRILRSQILAVLIFSVISHSC